jgi:hypothetical protein
MDLPQELLHGQKMFLILANTSVYGSSRPGSPPRMAKTKPLPTEPHIDYSDTQLPSSNRVRCNINLILKEASGP